MKGRAIVWTEEELSFVEWRQAMSRRALHAAFVARFGRDDVSIEALKQLCLRNGWTTGRTGCFEKGTVPLNKGKRCAEGTGGRHPNARRSQFKKGSLPHNTKFAGHERISKDGYVEISIDETNPYTGFARRYVQKHRWLWERANGPVPAGHALKNLDGNRQNTDPSNWIAVPRALLPRLNGRFGRDYDAAPAELKPIILKIAKLEHAARERRKA